MASNNIFRTTAIDTSDVDTSASFLPRIYRTDTNKKFLHSTINQLVQPGTVKKVNGYVGRMYSKATSTDDIFIDAPSQVRQNYQLEPGLVIDDNMDNTVFFKDYQDYINQLKVFGADVSNHSKLNKQEFYSWNPHIDWDKFVNFQNYYWMPHGPDTVTIQNTTAAEVVSTYSVTVENTEYGSSYLFSPDGLTRNPVITLYKGQTYKFVIDSIGHPFSIKTLRTAGPLNRYINSQLDKNAIETGTITFTIPVNAPDELVYVSETNIDLGGIINILDLSDTSYINVDAEVVGKKTYKNNNITLSNGMRVQFAGNIFPKHYANNRYYVEGVGQSIQLINEKDLQIVTAYTSTESMLFDNTLFDTTPFSDSNSYVTDPDYIIINRASADRNFWSRNNKWVHKDVIETSSLANGITPLYDQSMRAIRPIIEFEKNLKLFNFGTKSIIDIAVIDNVTVDVFSIVEGSLGYNVDGVDLKHGQHVIFTADADIRVTNNIYRVEFIDVLHEDSLQKVSSTGKVGSIIATNNGWKATITGMTSTAGLTVGSVITATTKTGNLGGGPIGSTGTIRVSAIIDSTSIEYNVISGNKPSSGTVTDIINVINSNQIRLVEVIKPEYNQVVLVQYGIRSQGQMYWYNGTMWKLCQQKIKSNQPPRFDLVNNNEESFGDTSVYPGTTFNGTSIFSYKVGSTDIIDANLGFALSYKNINNIGDIVFNFSLITDSFRYELNEQIINKTVDTGFLITYDNSGTISYVNGWKTCEVNNSQAAIRLYRNSNKTNNFDIDIFNYLPDLNEIDVRVYVNNVRRTDWIFKSVVPNYQISQHHQIIFVDNTGLPKDINSLDTVMIKVYSLLSINSNGYYEIPINLQNNPLNGVLSEFTLGEVIDHVGSIVDNAYKFGFIGQYPGASNLRDLGPVSQFGTKFVQHSGPASLSMYHITSDTNNIIRAIDQSRDDYCKFKKTFLFVAETLGIDADPVTHVNLILNHINKDIPKTSPYYFSDMVPYNSSIRTDFTVAAPEDNLFLLSKVFSLTALSTRAVGVYLNDNQLLHSKEYSFTNQGFVLVTAQLQVNDVITIFEYESTDGCLVPETPTKLGIWPKYEPKIYLDTTLLIPRNMIQGHDGSLTLAYDDYRDQLILELEKRIYNNIKVTYDTSIFDIADIIPSYSRKSDYTRDQFNSILTVNFYNWASTIGVDFSTPLSYNRHSAFTFNYSNHTAPDGRVTPGFWRGIYQWILDTDRPNICPWEMLGFSEEPNWWTSVYGPAPYTRNNLVLWDDISKGLVKEPNNAVVILNKYVKPFLIDHIPVDDDGNLVSPYHSNLSNGYVTPSVQADFVFGDVSPIENAWRRNSHYRFSAIKTAILMNPARLIGILLDRSRIVINKTGQLVYSDTNVRITPASVKFPSVYLSTSRTQTAGLINYLINYTNCDNLIGYNSYKSELAAITAKLCYRVSAFTSKEKFNLLLDSKSPTAVGSIFIPQEDYKISLNVSSPIGILTYSGVIITKIEGGFEIKGYSRLQPYFKYYPSLGTGTLTNVAGISESFVDWTQNQDYYAGMIVRHLSKYYRVTLDHTSSLSFNYDKFYMLDSLPIVGGVNAYFRNNWSTEAKVIQYGSKLGSIQAVVDFLLGYGNWLTTQGFMFDEFNAELQQVANWSTSAKEFMFWTTQNWTSPTTTWADWQQGMSISYGDIIRYNGEYYKALTDTRQAFAFSESEFYLLNSLDLSGSSVISVSPAANKLTFNTILSTVDDISNPINEYEILNANGKPIFKNFVNMFRIDNALTYTPRSDDGIYCASFYLVQREHVAILNNTTMFNDTIYSPESGYKQDKIKVSGYVSINWNGTLSAPGFMVDRAEITEWTPWKNYTVGDIVKYKSFYYSANTTLVGEEVFNAAQWIKLDSKPTSKLMPNWNYKATQFTDFYSLDSENFDIAQQQYAQHLTGYQKRQYLENIIQDDVSEYKFYQGMIIEKGTQNVLNKLFDVLSETGNESLKFYEEWAVRTGQYGACAAFENIEFTLSESKFKINPQGFELVNDKDQYNDTLVIQQGISDIYLKPINYSPNLWPVAKPTKISTVYARADEVNFSVKTLSEIDIAAVNDGNYILCTFESNNWNVYQYVARDINVSLVTSSLTEVEITVDNLFDIKQGSVIGIKNAGDDGFYTVDTVVNNVITLVTTASISKTDDITIGNLISRRINDDSVTETIENTTIDYNNYLTSDLTPGCLLWTDNDTLNYDNFHDTTNWKVWEYNPVYKSNSRISANLSATRFGRAIATSEDGKIVAVSCTVDAEYSTNNGEVVIYNNTAAYGWIPTQTISRPLKSKYNISNINVATVVALSADGTWLAVGSPNVSGIQHGVVLIYKRDITNLYVLTNTIVSPTPSNVEMFGKTISFGTNMLFIGTANGKVYRYKYKITERVSTTYTSTGSKGTTLVVASTNGVERGMIVSGKGFTNEHIVDAVSAFKPLGNSIPNSGTYTGVTQKNGGTSSGTGAVFTITKLNTELTYTNVSVIATTAGSNYDIGTTILIDGSLLGGVSGLNDLTLTVVNAVSLTIAPVEKPAGRVIFSVYTWDLVATMINNSATSAFGTSFAVSIDNTIAIADPSANGKVYLYYEANNYATPAVISNSVNAEIVGSSIALSKNSNYIAVSSKISSHNTQVDIYSLPDVTNVQTIITNEFNSNYSSKVLFTNDFSTLVIGSINSAEQFDAIDVYNRYENMWISSERVTPALVNKDTIAATSVSVIACASTANSNVGIIYDYVKPVNQYSWKVKNKSIAKPDITKIKQAFLYNKQTNKLIKYLDVVDPIQNKNPIIADCEIKYKSSYDPATYSFVETNADTFTYNKNSNANTDVFLNDRTKINVDEGIAWGESQIGSLWWNVRTAKFVDNFTDSTVYRNSMLSTLATGASVDIYEWIGTDLLPSEWDADADTTVGLASGISGTSLYGDNAYVEVQEYDTISQRFSSTYYYWVKNKETISSSIGRSISAANVSRLIANPKGEGYEYLALTGLNSFSLVNVKPLLADDNVVLSIEYWTVDKTDQNIHTQWKIISNAVSTVIPLTIEQKWIDSLCGKDANNRLVPDQLLPAKLKYGIENRPRQSMFINRFEAIKQVIEQTNLYLKANLIVDTRNLSNILKYDTPPTDIQRLYDTTLDTEVELSYVITKYYIAPTLTVDITDGKITHVNIVSSGQGFMYAPSITVLGNGTDCVLHATIDNFGSISSVKIVNGGSGYTSNTVVSVRKFAVLVLSDSTSNGKWSIYSYITESNQWYKSLTYTYDTTKYWNYVDWYATGYNQFTTANYLINTYADLLYLTAAIGDIVKVQTTTSGRWVLLKKYDTLISDDWTQSYKVIGSENGTIQFSSLLYDFNNTVVGFDGMLYDSNVYDNYASIELRNILTAIKDDLLIDDLKGEYLNLFFATVRYAMTEQIYVDWIFKTSFVNVMHQVGKLHQSVTYKNDNLSNFEDYVSEVKPYRTQVREYVSSYTNLDNSNLTVSDFDLPSTYDPNTKQLSTVDYDNPLINTYPWKHWLDNVGYSVVDIKIVNKGSEYLTVPEVKIKSNTGAGATAQAFITNKQISRIKLITPGSGYTTAPTIEIIGGYSNSGTIAVAIPILGNSVVRSADIKLKFDRVDQDYVINDLQYEETLQNITGTQIQYTLKWVPDVTIGKTLVTVNGIIEIRDNYKMGTVISIVNDHPVHTGVITFTTAPAKNSIIVVSYYRDTSNLSATDRIHHFYNPTSGQLGNDLPQLMLGIDYGGVVVSGLNFEIDHGWDSMPYQIDTWDNFIPENNDVKYTVGPEFSYTIKMPYVPAVGTKFNVYYKKNNLAAVRIDANDYEIDVINVEVPTAIMLTPIANGNTDIIEIPMSINVVDGDVIIIRKETSDGSAENTYDVSLTGGSFEYLSASGLLAEDIIIDGDSFDSSIAGVGPEEVVPGQVVDTFSIKVFNNSSSGAFMQFKDVLNTFRYIRLNADKKTKLLSDLHYNDTTIVVEDSSMFDFAIQAQNKPGVIDINGERIEFFSNENNVLSGLRRGTLGTGIPAVHTANSVVQEISSSETIPYTDNIQIEHIVVTESTANIINLSFAPKKIQTTWSFSDPLLEAYGQSNEIEVFVGGYDTSKQWSEGVVYNINDIVNVGVYVYRCTHAHTSGSNFKYDRSNWNYFIGNTRLRKEPYAVYNVNDGLVQFDADFAVDGTTKSIRLTNLLSINTLVTVVRRRGNMWVENQNELNFVNLVPGSEY